MANAAPNCKLRRDELNVPQRTLYDIRDGETYRVRKLADGNVWMTENLRLTLTEGQAIEISDGSMWLPTNYDGTTTNSTTLTVADYDDLPTIWGFTGNGRPDVEVVRSFDMTGMGGQYKCTHTWKGRDGDICYETRDTDDGETQKIGVFYNIYTATAGEVKLSTTSTDSTRSICPKNWVLPRKTDSDHLPSYDELIVNTYNAGATYHMSYFPLSFIRGNEYVVDLAATWYNDPSNQYGDYLTSSNNDSDIDWKMAVIRKNGGFAGGGTRKRGARNVRCAISGL